MSAAILLATAGYSSSLISLDRGMIRRKRGFSGVCLCVVCTKQRYGNPFSRARVSGRPESRSRDSSERKRTPPLRLWPSRRCPPTKPPLSLISPCCDLDISMKALSVSGVRTGERSLASSFSSDQSTFCHVISVRLFAMAIFILVLAVVVGGIAVGTEKKAFCPRW